MLAMYLESCSVWGEVTVQVVGARRSEQLRVAGLLAALSAEMSAAYPGALATLEIVGLEDNEVKEAELVDEKAALAGRHRGGRREPQLSVLLGPAAPCQ